jgi:hypothetical protein
MLETALSVAAIALSVIAAGLAIGSFFVSRAAMRQRSTASMRAELDEIHDALQKHSVTMRRISSREYMRERRSREADEEAGSGESSPEAQRPGESAAAWKARMRAKLIVPGKPAKHA